MASVDPISGLPGVPDFHRGGPLPPNMGDHHVRPINREVGGVIDNAKHEMGKLSHQWKRLDDKQKNHFRTAATCAMIAVLIIFILGFLLGGPLSLAAQFAFIPLLGAAHKLNKGIGNARLSKPYTMPPYSKEIKDIESPAQRAHAKSEWARLWRTRTQEKVALENVRATITYKKRKHLDVTKERVAEMAYLKQYEDADVAFWKFAKEEKANDKIQKINESRQKRGEPIRLSI